MSSAPHCVGGLLQAVTALQSAGSSQQVLAATAAAGQARPPGPALQQEGQEEEDATGVQTATNSSSSNSPSTAATRQPRPWQMGLPAAPRPRRCTRPTQRLWRAQTQLLQQQPQPPLPGRRLTTAGVVGRPCLALCLPRALLLPPPMSTGVGRCLVGVTLWQQYPFPAAGASQWRCTCQAQAGAQMAPCKLL